MTSSLVSSPASERLWLRLPSRLPWLSIAARGLPAVPLVNISAARSSSSTSTRSTGSAASSASNVVSANSVRRGRTSVATTCSTRRDLGAVDGRPGTGGDGIDEHHLGADDGQLAGDLRRRARRVERDGDGAETGRGQVRGDEEPTVAAQQGDTVAAADAEAGEAAAEVGDLIAQRAIGGRPVPADDRYVIVRMAVDDGRDVHWTPSGGGC